MMYSTRHKRTYNQGIGYVYLLHLAEPLSPAHTAQHYIGWTNCLARRLEEHWLGIAARFTQVARERDIRVRVVRAWRAAPTFERLLKQRKEGPRMCPICGYGKGIFINELSLAEIEEMLIAF